METTASGLRDSAAGGISMPIAHCTQVGAESCGADSIEPVHRLSGQRSWQQALSPTSSVKATRVRAATSRSTTPV